MGGTSGREGGYVWVLWVLIETWMGCTVFLGVLKGSVMVTRGRVCELDSPNLAGIGDGRVTLAS